LAEKNCPEEAKLWYPEPPAVQSFSTPHYTEKPGGLPYRQTPAQTCLGDADQQVSK
jgi:hypothetical protein